MWIEQRGKQFRVYYRTGLASPQKAYRPFPTRDQAQAFIELAKLAGLTSALGFLDHRDESALRAALNLTAPAGVAAAATGDAGAPAAPREVTHPGQERHLVGLTFAELWDRFLRQLRHLEETTADDYESYGKHHLLPFFGAHDLGLIQRTPPLRASDAVPGAIYVDHWVDGMLLKERMNRVGNPMTGKLLSVKFISNVLAVLAQCFDLALHSRPALLEVNPARDIRLPKQDRREMFFLEDQAAYLALRRELHDQFKPLLDFLVGTGARFGEGAGLLVRNVRLNADRPYVEIRLVLKWARKRWKLGRPKTRSSVRRIYLSPRLVAILRPLIVGKGPDEHVFTMVEGGPLHHGNFSNRYFKPAVKAAGAAVPARLRIHDLRHTHASWLLSDGAPIIYVQQRLGHSSSAMTQDIYGHITPEADDRALQIIDRRLPDVLAHLDGDGAEVVKLTGAEKQLPEFDVDDYDDLAA